jgi:serine protease Do
VVAIGNPFGLASSVSAGILSARARDIGAGPYDDFLQTDAAINPGNSGGPLFNLQGEVIGINTAIVGGGAGIGFAVPSNLAKALLPQLEKGGPVTRGWLGVAAQDLDPALASALDAPGTEGALVTHVEPRSPAFLAGLRPDDIVLALDGEPIVSAGALTRAVALKAPGTRVELTVWREGERRPVPLELGTRPDYEGVTARAPPPVREGPHEGLGLAVEDVPPRFDLRARARGEPPTRGALVVRVEPGSPAERAELQPGMVIVELEGTPVKSAADLRRGLAAAPRGKTVLLRVQLGEARQLRALPLPK